MSGSSDGTDETRFGKLRFGTVRPCPVWRVCGKARRGAARHGSAREGKGFENAVRSGRVRILAYQGRSGYGSVGLG